MTEIGWRLRLRNFVDSTGGETPFYPFASSGSLSFDLNREVPKTISSLTLPPSESNKLTNAGGMELELTMVRDAVEYLMGYYSFSEDTLQKAVVLDEDGTTADLRTVSLGDRLSRLIRNDGTAHSLLPGFDPAQELNLILMDANLPASVSGTVNVGASPVTWDGSTTELAKVKQLAELAGHRPPWMDNQGVIKSIQGRTRYGTPIKLSSLEVVGGSIGITNSYLTAPNRVIVVDNSFAEYELVGQWDAPSSAPHSFANLGYHRTEIVNLQGLGSSGQAQIVAETIGERATARGLDFQCVPTHILDGPVRLAYDGSNWLVESWSVNMAPGSKMSVSCTEIIGEENL